jgi:adenine-specific DNA-methyltransferase
MPLSFVTHVETIFKQNDKFVDKDDKLFVPKILEAIEKIDSDLIKLLMSDEKLKKHFFMQVDEVYVLKQNDLIEFFTMNEYLNHSYTSYTNKIGLIKKDNFIKKFDDVVLAFPHKDCILEGGQTKDDDKKNEVFYNSIISRDETDRLFEPKVLTNIKRVDKDGEHSLDEIKEDDNLIIKGNNLLALHSLKKRYAGKVKLIYIDPPYNTGSDSFNYNDNFNHSTWLTFMKNRLEVARELLAENGFIFVQCDDNEQAYLKVLMDEIFGIDNFINIISAKMKNIAGASGGGEDKRLKKNIEFLTIFSKNYKLSSLKNTYEYTELFDLVENYKIEKISWKYTSVLVNSGKKEYFISTKDGDGNEIKIYKRKNPIFKSISQIAKEEKISQKEVYYKYITKIFTTAMPQSSIRVRVLEKLINENFDFISIEYTPRSGKHKGKVYEQFYKGEKLRLITWLNDVTEQKDGEIFKKDLQGTLWDGFNLNNLSKEGNTVFESGKKPEELLKKVLEISTDKNDIILDFHLGSGTTCAVAHKMGRRYIGIEQMDYIEDIAVERMKKVIEGEQGGISKTVEWQGGGSFIYAELKEIDNFTDAEVGKLNQNMQYLPISDIEDEEYGISKEEIKINKNFYGLK